MTSRPVAPVQRGATVSWLVGPPAAGTGSRCERVAYSDGAGRQGPQLAGEESGGIWWNRIGVSDV